jgi:F-type H+-transporting ATPase subunit delta
VSTGTIARRYARAFFEVAREDNCYKEYYEELQNFSALLDESKNLREFLANPVFDRADKKAVTDSILGKIKMSGMTASFLRLLVDKRRMGILSEITDCYRELMDAALGRARVHVKTAFPLTGELSAGLQKGLETMTGKKIEITMEEDAALLGGVVVRIGDTLYDGSIRTQLNNMRNLLVEEI